MLEPVSFLTVPQIAQRWGVRDVTILKMIRDGHLKALNIGAGRKKGHWRITEEEIKRFEESRTVTPN